MPDSIFFRPRGSGSRPHPPREAPRAGTPRAEQIRDCIQGLIWRDAVVLGDAISYFQDLAASECITDDAWAGQDRAEARWAPWEATDEPARKAMDDFMYDYCDTQFLYRPKP